MTGTVAEKFAALKDQLDGDISEAEKELKEMQEKQRELNSLRSIRKALDTAHATIEKKRPRGRPKGSTNKPKDGTTSTGKKRGPKPKVQPQPDAEETTSTDS
jgi:hypothetical protein